MIRIIKDNVILSIKDEDLSQYEARGFEKIEEVAKVTSSNVAMDSESNSRIVEYRVYAR